MCTLLSRGSRWSSLGRWFSLTGGLEGTSCAFLPVALCAGSGAGFGCGLGCGFGSGFDGGVSLITFVPLIFPSEPGPGFIKDGFALISGCGAAVTGFGVALAATCGN